MGLRIISYKVKAYYVFHFHSYSIAFHCFSENFQKMYLFNNSLFSKFAGSSIKFSPDVSIKQVKTSEMNLIEKMEEIFQRDWYSDLARHF